MIEKFKYAWGQIFGEPGRSKLHALRPPAEGDPIAVLRLFQPSHLAPKLLDLQRRSRLQSFGVADIHQLERTGHDGRHEIRAVALAMAKTNQRDGHIVQHHSTARPGPKHERRWGSSFDSNRQLEPFNPIPASQNRIWKFQGNWAVSSEYQRATGSFRLRKKPPGWLMLKPQHATMTKLQSRQSQRCGRNLRPRDGAPLA